MNGCKFRYNDMTFPLSHIVGYIPISHDFDKDRIPLFATSKSI